MNWELSNRLGAEAENCARAGLHLQSNETDSCGVGFIASIAGQASRRVLDLGLTSLANVAHRGALGADGKTGDGAGISTDLPKTLVSNWIEDCAGPSGDQDWADDVLQSRVGVGMIFLPMSATDRQIALDKVNEVLREANLEIIGYRDVPVDAEQLGAVALKSCPHIVQLFVKHRAGVRADDLERQLFLARRAIDGLKFKSKDQGVYFASFSCRTIVYKALVHSANLANYYLDLQNPAYKCSTCIYHQRFSTNTFPSWELCQPFRMLAHNGEINTIRGNRNWMAAREPLFQHPVWQGKEKLLSPVTSHADSDSASLDNVLELLTLSGRATLAAMTMLIPPAWQNDKLISQTQRDYYEFISCFSEPWDGPAAVVFSDGQTVAACVDRNGLRPARFRLTNDGLLIVGSESGAEDIDFDQVKSDSRLSPGQMIAVDTVAGKVLLDHEIKESLASAYPFAQWLAERRQKLGLADPPVSTYSPRPADLTRRQIAAGMDREEIDMVVVPTANTGQEPTFSMGIDTPLSVLSKRPRSLASYFKQRFAQVTNPPIDPIRERQVMSLSAALGPEHNLLEESPEHCRVLELDCPILFDNELRDITTNHQFPSVTIDCSWDCTRGTSGLFSAIERICREAERAVDDGIVILVLSDRYIDKEHIAIPMLAAVGAVHHRLCKTNRRMRSSIVADTADTRDPHQLAVLFGFGATAVCPYLTWATIIQLHTEKKLSEDIGLPTALENYLEAFKKGLLKIMSKLGISVLNSFQGAQTFEAIGIGVEVIIKCFPGTISQIGGADFDDIARDCWIRHDAGYKTDPPELEDSGIHRARRGGELHLINGRATKSMHTFVKDNDEGKYKKFLEETKQKNPVALRDLLELVPASHRRVELHEVEPIEAIRTRFTTAAMSLGAISPEAHEAIAIAMNAIGGKSNSGEGGEDARRFKPYPDGSNAISRIKQVASGRFGVTTHYLVNADELEIKMAQGAKPGEGGQLPAHKVNEMIAKLRRTEVGIALISPPPHHDIYSIEDIAQLIYDLKMVNSSAQVCVKLVAKSGVGSIAAGLVKANADIVLISGHEGGTGASPLTSIKHAGIPWELGLAETHQVLTRSGLRDRVTLRVDGGLKNGVDIVKAAILGAEEFNFGTMALIALGCVYVRKCHLNNCPVGIATQDPKFRARFKGKSEHLITYLNAVAQQCREIMAELGVKSLDELIGQTQFLWQKKIPEHHKANKIDLGRLLLNVSPKTPPGKPVSFRTVKQITSPPIAFDDRFLDEAELAVENEAPVTFEFEIKNTDRNIGTRLSGQLARKFDCEGLTSRLITLELKGTAGQSLGAFLINGISIRLVGIANDYVGKGMSGGKIAISPHAINSGEYGNQVIIGNTVLYGATGGKLFAAGQASERFCVRNSGAIAVVEGCGDHGCEYMTGGTVVILGATGSNFGAGMSGGVVFVYDPESELENRCNFEMIEFQDVEPHSKDLRQLVNQHFFETNSQLAHQLLENWDNSLHSFKKIAPKTAEPAETKSCSTMPDSAKQG